MNTSNNQDKDSALALILILLIVEIITKEESVLIAEAVILILAMTVPVIFRPFSILWFGLSRILGHYSSIVILTLLWSILITPVACVRRLAGSDSLMLNKWKGDELSAFTINEHLYEAEDMKRPF